METWKEIKNRLLRPKSAGKKDAGEVKSLDSEVKLPSDDFWLQDSKTEWLTFASNPSSPSLH